MLLFLNRVVRGGLTEVIFAQQLMKNVDIREIVNVLGEGSTCAKALR